MKTRLLRNSQKNTVSENIPLGVGTSWADGPATPGLAHVADPRDQEVQERRHGSGGVRSAAGLRLQAECVFSTSRAKASASLALTPFSSFGSSFGGGDSVCVIQPSQTRLRPGEYKYKLAYKLQASIHILKEHINYKRSVFFVFENVRSEIRMVPKKSAGCLNFFEMSSLKPHENRNQKPMNILSQMEHNLCQYGVATIYWFWNHNQCIWLLKWHDITHATITFDYLQAYY